jgi:hypothetical protein
METRDPLEAYRGSGLRPQKLEESVVSAPPVNRRVYKGTDQGLYKQDLKAIVRNETTHKMEANPIKEMVNKRNKESLPEDQFKGPRVLNIRRRDEDTIDEMSNLLMKNLDLEQSLRKQKKLEYQQELRKQVGWADADSGGR